MSHTKRTIRIFVVLGLLGWTSWIGCGRRDAIFRAYSDGIAAWWSLDLSADRSFQMHLGGGDFEGQFRLQGDTIFLSYPQSSAAESDLPVAYCIDSARVTILDLIQDEGGRYKRLGGNWMRVQEDHLPH